jgi:maltose O-acetyltransferase
VIENGAWVGSGVIILKGVRIGQNAVVGAGSVVTRDVEANTVAAGNPAKTVRRLG